ncbi:Carbonic anhydrase or acetyltransferase, isoleucine patch superfamily [Paracoccus aminovorans]|uniref:Carbonic anhydrase or acetyltransferase, isoleucine patch superfamily n=1 Tax=Paracoccus aminovorans TaxID=34004 RepID=A0A1I2Y399_9RHOB|nr:gamma carbonic anhydrase family protein [Paracoccus aminovorans]CQR86063.1 transferase hexapeptide protein [Paracoccus aminovorans]SFH20143.1 Carbonic anhydrase or acetyltransferase, isoleucine patch superfamily [Paracoccus aminovorans]
MIWELDGIVPKLEGDAWVAPSAQLMGKVVLEPGASVWFGAVLRGDNEEIRVGRNSNVQDLTVCHTDIGYPLTIGANCTIGHRAILHGCTIEDGVLVGMGATIMNGARIGAGSLIGAGALVAEGKVIPPGSLVMGAPGKIVRELDDIARAQLLKSAEGYKRNAARFRKGLTRAFQG